MSAVTFDALCAAAERLGADIGIARTGDRHEIVLIDDARCRSVRVPVTRSFDAAATVLCCSLALARAVAGVAGEAVALAEAWPELAELADVR